MAGCSPASPRPPPRGSKRRAVRPAGLHLRRDRRRCDAVAAARRARARAWPSRRGAGRGRRRSARRRRAPRDVDRLRRRRSRWCGQRDLGPEWRVADRRRPARSHDLYLRRAGAPSRGVWWRRRATGATDAAWRAEYRRLPEGDLRGRFGCVARSEPQSASGFDLTLALSQVETNVPLEPTSSEVEIPPSPPIPITPSIELRTCASGHYAKINLSLRVLGRPPGRLSRAADDFSDDCAARHADHPRTARSVRAALRRCRRVPPTTPTWCGARPKRVWAASGRRGALRDVEITLDEADSDAGRSRRRQQRCRGGAAGARGALAGRRHAAARRWRATLGADVPYFLEGGTALGLDRGDVLYPLADHPPAWVTLVLPAFRRQHGRGVPLVGRRRRTSRRSVAGASGSQRRDGRSATRKRPQGPVAAHHPEIEQIVRRCGAPARSTRRCRAADRRFSACLTDRGRRRHGPARAARRRVQRARTSLTPDR